MGNFLLPVVFLVLLSVTLKLVFLWDSYSNGFLPRDGSTLFSDELTYLNEGRLFFDGSTYDYGVGTNWLYVFLNYVALNIFQTEGGAYIALGLMNILVSTISPFLLVPIIRDAMPDDRAFKRGIILLLALTLLWPQALILASHNLKDVLTQAVTLLYVVTFFFFFRRSAERSLRVKELLVAVTALGAILLLLFSLRIYLAAMLAAASMILLARKKPLLALLGLALMVMFYFLFEERLVGFIVNNWLFSVDAREALLNEAFQSGDVQARVNVEPLLILGSAVRFFLAPFPSMGTTAYQWLLVAQSTVMYFLAYFALKGTRNYRYDLKGFMLILLFFLALFYGVAELISGPRQRFASFDYLFIAFATAGLVTAKRHEILYGLLGFAGIYFIARFAF
jgi:hypothetical protein